MSIYDDDKMDSPKFEAEQRMDMERYFEKLEDEERKGE